MPTDPLTIKELFLAALEVADPAERAATLDRKCGGDAKLRARLDELLAAVDRPASALGRPLVAAVAAEETGPGFPPDDPGASTVELAPAPAPGSPIGMVVAGRYKIRQEIGEGGMGVVYMAEQVAPVRRMVALKLIRAGMDSRTVLARFESERQALAIMDHPHIARVLDAGATELGHPFFVMELVRGIPLTAFCDRHRLGLRERLQLFRQICSAVQHAHQKGVIHRDLKPTNILVEDHDGTPVPKVIDFGLAKAMTGAPLTDRSLFTAFGAITGTPLYMAPEQATFNAIDVDTRADIYALGVILYELLTGSTPIRKETLERAALDEVLRVVREEDPPTPSSRVSTAEGLPSLAANRHVEPSRLGRFLRGDLDWIVMKALAKERVRRYDSATGLANDIERFLNDEPVTAGPPTARYRAAKFIRRHRGQVLAGSLVLLALVGGVVGTTLGLFEARRQRAEAEHERAIAGARAAEREEARRAAERRLAQVERANEILGAIFKDLDPNNPESEGRPIAVQLGERLDQATATIEGDWTDDPLAAARMRLTLGQSQLGLGRTAKAIDLLSRAHDAVAGLLGPEHPTTLEALKALAMAHHFAGELDRGIALYERALPAMRAVLGPEHEATLTATIYLAGAQLQLRRPDLAAPVLERTLVTLRDKLGPDDPLTLGASIKLAEAYNQAGQPDRALLLLDRVLPALRAKLGADHPKSLAIAAYPARAHVQAGRPGRGVALLEPAAATLRAKLGPNHYYTRDVLAGLAEAYRADGQLDRAAALLRELVDAPRAGSDREPADLAGRQAQLGQVLIQQGRWPEAEAILRRSLATLGRTPGDDLAAADARSLLGEALLGQHRYDEAGPLLTAGYEAMRRRLDQVPPADRGRPAAALDRLVRLAEATGQPDRARAWREEKGRIPAAPTQTPAPSPDPIAAPAGPAAVAGGAGRP